MIEKIKEYVLKFQDKDGALEDPIFKIKRNRVAAEIGKSLFFIGEKEKGIKSINWVLSHQNQNGSWNEIHPDLNEESTVVTSICGRIMFEIYKKTKNKKYFKSAKKAAEYVLTKEFEPGFFIKSYYHYADVLNVNATVLSLISNFNEKKFKDACKRIIFNISRNQFKNGALPYSSYEQRHPYEYHLHIPDIHYQATTLYFLLISKTTNKYLEITIKKAINWLKSTIEKKGFKWNMSFLTFSHKVTGAYGFAEFCFKKLGYNKEENYCLKKIKKLQNKNGSFSRYEKRINLIHLILGVCNEFCSDEKIGINYSFFTRTKRSKERIKREIFDIFFKNNESLIYTSQIFDCLTEMKMNE